MKVPREPIRWMKRAHETVDAMGRAGKRFFVEESEMDGYRGEDLSRKGFQMTPFCARRAHVVRERKMGELVCEPWDKFCLRDTVRCQIEEYRALYRKLILTFESLLKDVLDLLPDKKAQCAARNGEVDNEARS